MSIEVFCVSPKKYILIFSGFNQRSVISFIRTLEANNIDFAIIAIPVTDSIFLTEYSEKVLSVRKYKTLDINDILNSIETVKEKIQADEYIIAPSTEALNRFLLEYRVEFENAGCKIPLVEKKVYESISNKYSFGQICRNYGINIPEEVDIHKQIAFPIVAKPIEYYSTNNEILSPVIIQDSRDFNSFISRYNTKDFYYQEYVNGRSYYLLYYYHSNGDVYKFSQENLIQQPGGKSILAAIPSNIHISNEADKYERLFKELNFFGLVMIEVKQNENSNYMIEANPRFWGPSQLFVDADANFFEAFLHDVGVLDNVSFPEEHNFLAKYFWFGGLEKYMEKSLNEIVFYNYNTERLYREFWDLLKSDIYYKKDTKNIFAREVFKVKGDGFFEK